MTSPESLEDDRLIGEAIIARAHALDRCPLCLEPLDGDDDHIDHCATIVPADEADRRLDALEA